jgi:hypothetical protein
MLNVYGGMTQIIHFNKAMRTHCGPKECRLDHLIYLDFTYQMLKIYDLLAPKICSIYQSFLIDCHASQEV